ncbi:MAG: DNA polymerase III subunit delta [Firmicutes bacterium]|nr:DNA polymerase III subunit delta [Bacillota bacterium]
MNRADFLKAVAENRLLPAYLFLGEEELFQQELVHAAVEKLLSLEEREFGFLRLHAANVAPLELVSQLETPAFFTGNRVILLESFEESAAGVEEAALKGLGNLPPGVYFFITAAKLDGRKRVHQELQKRVTAVDCAKLRPADLGLWIRQRAEKMGLKLTAAQIGLIGERLGTDLLRIRTELQKLRAFAGDKAEVSNPDLEALIPGEPESDIFGLIDAVARRDPRLGLPKLEDLLDSGENELKILIMLARQFRNITAAIAAREQGLTPKQLAESLGINPYVAEKSFTQSGQFTLPSLQRILERLINADYNIKTGQREPRLELELAVVEITANHFFR